MAPLPVSPFTPPDRDRRGDSPAPGRAPPRHAHGDLTSLAPHERLTEILVVPREKTPTGAAARGADVTVTHCHPFISSLIHSACAYQVPDNKGEAVGKTGLPIELPVAGEVNTVKQL